MQIFKNGALHFYVASMKKKYSLKEFCGGGAWH